MTEPQLTSELREVLTLLATDPAAAADKIDQIADQLHRHAETIRGRLAEDNDFVVEGGMTDRVKMTVTGPDGEIKQRVDTGDNYGRKQNKANASPQLHR